MKKGFTSIELMITIVIISCLGIVLLCSFSEFSEDYDNANYRIETNNGIYYVESYTKEDNGTCVYMSENETRFCGEWSVEKINKD